MSSMRKIIGGLGWNDSAAFVSGQNADIEIGQPDFQTTLCNSGTAIGGRRRPRPR